MLTTCRKCIEETQSSCLLRVSRLRCIVYLLQISSKSLKVGRSIALRTCTRKIVGVLPSRRVFSEMGRKAVHAELREYYSNKPRKTRDKDLTTQ